MAVDSVRISHLNKRLRATRIRPAVPLPVVIRVAKRSRTTSGGVVAVHRITPARLVAAVERNPLTNLAAVAAVSSRAVPLGVVATRPAVVERNPAGRLAVVVAEHSLVTRQVVAAEEHSLVTRQVVVAGRPAAVVAVAARTAVVAAVHPVAVAAEDRTTRTSSTIGPSMLHRNGPSKQVAEKLAVFKGHSF
jgi:hypothetical protein